MDKKIDDAPLIIDTETDQPEYFDIIMTDFEEFPTTRRKSNIQNDVAKFLEVSYLVETTSTPTFPVYGIIHGDIYRSFVNLICTVPNGKPTNVIFCVGSGKSIDIKI